ncbi:MAG TPA: hypothetical protein VGC85_09115 [Chthoniobacterales bacterium]
MAKPVIFLILLACGLAAQPGHAEGLSNSTKYFHYRDVAGKVTSVRIVHRYYGVVHPDAKIDSRIDPRLRRAASIAQERASAQTKARCWHYVKEALLESGAVNAYPRTAYACQAGDELVQSFGFKKLPMRDPYAAPVGAVIVYGRGSGGAGHVELRTKNGFVSDYYSKNRCFYPVLAVYAKYSS